MNADAKPDLPLHQIAATIPALPGWTALSMAHDAEGKRVEVAPGLYQVEEHPIAAWGLLVSISRFSFFDTFIGSSLPSSCPLAADGSRLDNLPDFICLSPPGETMAEAIARVAPKSRETEKKESGR